MTTAFTRATQNKLTALRVAAYSLATFFMIVMVVRGVWITRNEAEAEIDRSVAAAAVALDAMARQGGLNPARAQDLLQVFSPPGVSYRLETQMSASATAVPSADSDGAELRRMSVAGGRLALVARIDHAAIWNRAVQTNLPFMLFVSALGLPTIMIFLYMGWMVNAPALQLLAFAQSDDETRQPPVLPKIWHGVLARLKALRDSQAQMQALLDNAPIGMMFRHADGRLATINRFGAGFFTPEPDGLLGKPCAFFDSRFPDYATLVGPLFLDPLAGTATTVETAFDGPGGERLTLLIWSFAVRSRAGSVDLVGNIFVDVTEERRAEAELEESRASLQAFFDNLPGFAFLTALDGTITAANAYIAEQFDLPNMRPDILQGKNGTKLLPASWSQHARDAIATNEQDGKPYNFSTTVDLPDGRRHLSASRFPIHNADGKITHIGGLVFDRTREVAAAAKIAAAHESLVQSEKLAALGSMLAGVSHELNNPLSAVIGQAALLAEDLDGTDHAERVGKIKRAADRCARIVQSFLAMARQKAPAYRLIDINDLVASAAELTEYQLRAANVRLELRLAGTLPRIEADPDQMHQVVVNLVVNARQALEETAGERRITIATSQEGDSIRLSVSDTGKGIDAATRDRIFDPFFTTKAVGTGTGIGLSYSRGVVEAHGGSIAVQSLTPGTMFVISLPLQSTGTAPIAPETVAAKARKGRALIIDDEAEVADTLADMLSRMGIDAVVATGGAAGQAALASGAAFDLVLSDIRMPDLDGPALYAWIRANRPDLAGCVAFVTGDTLSGIAAAFLDSVKCPFLEKPFTPAALRALIADMLPS